MEKLFTAANEIEQNSKKLADFLGRPLFKSAKSSLYISSDGQEVKKVFAEPQKYRDLIWWKYLKQVNYENSANPKTILWDHYFRPQGFTYDFVPGITLREYLATSKNDLENRKAICELIIKYDEDLLTNFIRYTDWNLDNLIINPATGKAKVIDMNATRRETKQHEHVNYLLTLLAMSVLYGCDLIHAVIQEINEIPQENAKLALTTPRELSRGGLTKEELKQIIFSTTDLQVRTALSEGLERIRIRKSGHQ